MLDTKTGIPSKEAREAESREAIKTIMYNEQREFYLLEMMSEQKERRKPGGHYLSAMV
jgi:hypothetical protein